MKKQFIALTGAFTIAAVTLVGAGSASAKSITINKGDTLSELAITHNTTVNTLKQLNGLTSDLIFAGAALEVGDGTGQVTYQAPVQQKQVVQQAPVQQKQVTYQAPVQQKTTYKAPVQQKQAVQQAPVQKKAAAYTPNSSSAKEWIAMKESTNNYNAVSASGTYVGKYQLTRSYLNGDTSPANQERVADKYVKDRYGSWEKAKAFHQANGWY